MQKRELVRAADKILGDSFKLKAPRSKRVNNPEYRAIPVRWSIHIDKPGLGSFSIFMGGKGNLSLSIPFEMHNGVCLARKFAIKKIYDLGNGIETEDFSLLPKDGKKMDGLAKTVNGIVDIIVKIGSDVISKNSSGLIHTDQITLIRPAVFGIPKTVTVQELSLEGLQYEGQLPKDLKGFKTI